MAAPRAPGKPIEFGPHALCGVAPYGVRWLLDETSCNREGIWQRSQEFWAHGVMCMRTTTSDTGIDARISRLAERYPVNGKELGVVVHERKLRGTATPHYMFRGDHIVGDCVDLASTWADFYTKASNVGWDLSKEAMCWSGQAPGAVFVPYIDLDEHAPDGAFSMVWSDRVLPTILAINAALAGLGVRPERTPIFMNIRPIDGSPGLSKHSFHVHWPGLGIRNIGTWKSFLLSLEDLPRALDWKLDEGKWCSVVKPGAPPIVDMSVYGGKSQLFRGPFSGKRGDSDSVMFPVVVSGAAGGDYVFRYINESTGCDRAKMIEHILNARITAHPTDVKILDIPTVNVRPVSSAGPSVASVRSRVCVEPSVAPMDPTIDDVHRFITPFLERFILPEWQSFRRQMLMRLSGVTGAVVPTKDLVIKYERKAERRGRAFFSVDGDTFCECDANHVHTVHTGRIGFVIDYVRATIAQTCFVCGPSVRFPVYSFLHTGNAICIKPRDRCGHSRISCWGKSDSPHQAFVDFYGDRVCLERDTRMIYVYDDEKRVWSSGEEGNAITGRLIDKLNRIHSEYLDAQRRVFMDIAIAKLDGEAEGDEDDDEDDDCEYDDEDEGKSEKKKKPMTREEAIKLLEKKSRMFIAKRTKYLTLTPDMRQKFLLTLGGTNVHVQVLRMNPVPHLIPMRTGQYIDVFTGAIADMERNHFFTSVVNAEFKPDDANIQTLTDWFSEISTGDTDKARYLKIIGAYCWTMLVHDRKYYFIDGTGSNGKGVYKEFVVIVAKGPEGYEKRVKMLNANYWSARGNAGANAESATPEAFKMQHSSVYYTDEVNNVKLDAPKLKRTVASEEQSSRGLYGKPCDIKPRGKVLMTSNFDPNGPGDDQAFWDRTVVVRMNAKYVEDPAQVNPAKHRFLKDFAAADRLLTMTDAFFTICVTELVRYYQSVKTANGTPLLVSFPMPADIKKTTLAAKEKRMPLAAFVRKHLADTANFLQYVKIQDAFQNYMRFLENSNETLVAKTTTVTSFEELLAMALGITTVEVSGCTFIEGKHLVSHVTEQQQTHRYQYTGFVDQPTTTHSEL